MVTENEYTTDVLPGRGNRADEDNHQNQNVEEMVKYFIVVGVLAGVCALLAAVNLYLQWRDKKKKPVWVKKGSSGLKREERPVKTIKANFLFSSRPSTSMEKP